MVALVPDAWGLPGVAEVGVLRLRAAALRLRRSAQDDKAELSEAFDSVGMTKVETHLAVRFR
jgi:hypothetical protein